ncbi:hypothetical protein RLOatenuis_1690 [Rickettsiales bacterium]|nr:hypothetical protein RLOatenuis_1690 [Rickettsiales bacterium]
MLYNSYKCLNMRTFLVAIICILYITNARAEHLLPENLHNKIILFNVTDVAFPTVQPILMHFQKTHYTYQILDTGEVQIGDYKYKILDPEESVTIIKCRDNYNEAEEEYSIILLAKDEKVELSMCKHAYPAVLYDEEPRA